MHIAQKTLNPVGSASLTAEETKILGWLRSAKWEPLAGTREPTLKTKVPEFFSGVRLYSMQAGNRAGAIGALELLLKKLQYQGVISKPEGDPVTMQGTARYLSLKKSDLDHLGAGQAENDED